jgi:uncharacterized protein (DUF849 family)
MMAGDEVALSWVWAVVSVRTFTESCIRICTVVGWCVRKGAENVRRSVIVTLSEQEGDQSERK